MSTWDKRYTDRVQLLVDILPTLAKEVRFALKGGTAINLFEHERCVSVGWISRLRRVTSWPTWLTVSCRLSRRR